MKKTRKSQKRVSRMILGFLLSLFPAVAVGASISRFRKGGAMKLRYTRDPFDALLRDTIQSTTRGPHFTAQVMQRLSAWFKPG